MKFLVPFLYLTFLLLGCKASEQTQEMPQCIASKIETLKNNSVQNPPSQVWKWKSNDKTFYYFNAACCDQYSYLYDTNCEVICAPDGGFTGKGDGKCPDLGENVKKTLIWKDERK